MSEFERAFYSEYRMVYPHASDWVKVGGTAPVTYQEACAEVLKEMEEDKTDMLGNKYEYRIVDTKDLVVMDGAELALESLMPAEPARKVRDWEAEGYSEDEILRRWRIVDAMIEEHDELVAARVVRKKAIRKLISEGSWIAAESEMIVLRSDRKRELELSMMLKTGD